MKQNTKMTTDWDEEWTVGKWINYCLSNPQTVPEEHRAAFEVAVERSGYGQVRAARRQRSVRGHTATSGGRGSPARRVSPCSWALPPMCVHARCCRGVRLIRRGRHDARGLTRCPRAPPAPALPDAVAPQAEASQWPVRARGPGTAPAALPPPHAPASWSSPAALARAAVLAPERATQHPAPRRHTRPARGCVTVGWPAHPSSWRRTSDVTRTARCRACRPTSCDMPVRFNLRLRHPVFPVCPGPWPCPVARGGQYRQSSHESCSFIYYSSKSKSKCYPS